MAGVIKVAVAGATGRVGRELVRAVAREADLELVAATGRRAVGEDVGTHLGLAALGVKISGSLQEALGFAPADVAVDFTRAEVAREGIVAALERRVHVVVGTTGFSAADLQQFEELAYRNGVGAAIIANFAIGAMLLARFAEQARQFFPRVEVVETHHDAKLDAPSGTAKRIAQRLEAAGGGPVPVHSLRLPGAVAHHEVVFGGPGQLLTLRHDSLSRESFVPGVLMAVRKVQALRGAVYDLDELVRA